ncbi:hypothetical protein H4R35_002332 [Dimargaris xerosporica]|nr:hypothetical protein H4R35_002332 [Dimargaris xerosporica]
MESDLYVGPGISETESDEIVSTQLSDQVKEHTVVVEFDLLRKQAMPRDTDAADRAIQIHYQVCNSGHLTPQPGYLTKLISGVILDEKAVYPEIQYLLDVCARAVFDGVRGLGFNHSVRQQTHLLQSIGQFDYVPIGADNNYRPDIAITAQGVLTDGYPDPPSPSLWRNIVAVIEVKWGTTANNTEGEPSPDTLDKTCGQLARYVLNMNTTQPNRRFAWSVFIINTYAYVCLLGRDRIYRTKAIDLGTLVGRQQFTQFVVYWSLAGPAQFGLDATLHYDSDSKNWVIECFDDADITLTRREFYAKRDTVFIRPSLFGRRTVSLSASAKPGGSATVFIKGAWPVSTPDAPGQDPRSETTLLRQIDEHFSKHDPGVPYPKLVLGGSVWQGGHGGLERDDTRLAYGAIDGALHSPDTDSPSPAYRVHCRMVMMPLAERLDTLDNFNDLIKVLTDVMACHRKLYDECKIFHRDISINNIMVVRQGSAVRGMLVDFDNAVPLSLKVSSGQPERTDTLPFMSIGNLENNDTERTSLDDWESILYVICWAGTYGFALNPPAKPMDPAAPKPTLHRWLKGSTADVASEKRNKMESPKAVGRIVECFQPLAGVLNLRRLTQELHLALFQYRKCPGAELVGPSSLELYRLTANRGNNYDPLYARVDYEKRIAKKCHKVLQAARNALDQPRGKKPRT